MWKGGAGGVKWQSQYVGPMRQFRGGQPSRNLRTRLGLRGDTPPAPPSQGGDDAHRNPDEDKACASRTFHHPKARGVTTHAQSKR